MPYVSLPGSVSLYYEHIRAFDASLPTLVCLSPAMHSLSLLSPMLSNPAWSGWNLILIDLRFHGRGSAPSSSAASLDFAVHAADVAFAMEALGLPAAHFYCPEVSAFHTGTHLAILFPELVLSLSFAGVYSLLTEQVAAKEIFGEIDSFIVFPDSESSFLDGIEGLVDLSLGPKASTLDVALVDKVANGFVKRYNPHHARYLPHTSPFRQPFRLRAEHLALIECPVLVMHGELDLAHPPAAAVEFYTALTACRNRQLYIIPEGPHCADLTHEPLVTARMAAFLAPFNTAPVSKGACTINRERAMELLANITGDARVLSRDSSLSDSFTSMSDSTLAKTTAWMDESRYRAAHYSIPIQGERTSRAWEQPLAGEWTFSKRHDFIRSQVQQEQHVRRLSGHTVAITCVKQVRKDLSPKEECWEAAGGGVWGAVERISAIEIC